MHPISPSSLLYPASLHADYLDSFSSALLSSSVSIEAVAVAFFAPPPFWLRWLSAWRDVLVAPFGLKRPKLGGHISSPWHRLMQGEKIGFFRILAQTPQEILLGDDEKHLSFQVSIRLSPQAHAQELSISSCVILKNRLGHVYFFLVRPFHRFIVPRILKRMVHALSETSS